MNVSLDKNGVVYISNTFGNQIFKFNRNEKNSIELLVQGSFLGRPNGLTVVDDKLYVASWGWGELNASNWTTPKKGKIYSINLGDGELKYVSAALGHLDGIEPVVIHGTLTGFVVTDWVSGKVYAVMKPIENVPASFNNLMIEEIQSSITNAADLELILNSDKNSAQLLIPDMGENKVVELPLHN